MKISVNKIRKSHSVCNNHDPIPRSIDQKLKDLSETVFKSYFL